MEKNLLGKVLGFIGQYTRTTIFHLFIGIIIYRELDGNNITTIEVIGWLMVSLLMVPLIAYLSTKYLSKKSISHFIGWHCSSITNRLGLLGQDTDYFRFSCFI